MKPLRGILMMSLAVSLFTVLEAMIKAAPGVPPGQAMFFRSAVAMPIVIFWLWISGDFRHGLRTRRPWHHLSRGVAGSIAMGLGFAGLHYLPLPEVTAIRFTTPLVMVILAAIILGERLRLFRITAVLVGLLGVAIILWPRLSLSLNDTRAFGALIVLGSAICAALAQIFIKSMAGREHTAAIVFYFSLTATILSLLTLPFGWVMPRGPDLLLLLGAGVVGGIGQVLLTASYRHADASTLAPFIYVAMVWAIAIGYVVFKEIPTPHMLSGSFLIIAAGVVIVLRERHLKTGTPTARTRSPRET